MTNQSQPMAPQGCRQRLAFKPIPKLRNEMAMSDDWRALYPFESHYLPLGSHRLHFVDEGRGQPLLLVHGNPTWSFYWRELIVALRSEYRVVAVDHLGCGPSDKPQNYQYCLQNHIDNLTQLIAALNLREATLVAHDWGGPIGLGAALALPERFDHLVVLNSAAFRSPYIPWQIRMAGWPWLGTFANRGLNAFLRGALRTALENHERMTPAVRAGYLAPYNSWHNRVAIDRFVKDIPRSPHHPSYTTLVQIETGLSTLSSKPWLFLWGLRDWCFHEWYLSRFLEFVPGAEVRRFPDAGHLLMEDKPADVVQAIKEFISKKSKA